MTVAATLLLPLLLPQLQVEPYQAEVGQPVVVSAARDGEAVVGAAVVVELPDGSRRPAGVTNERGAVRFVADIVGAHVARVEVGELLMMAPFEVVRARPRWLPAAVCVPLGLALLWRNLSRARDRRAP